MAPQNQFGRTSKLCVKAERREDGTTYLSDVAFTAPYKIMHPFIKPDGGAQIIPVCASAGIMRGDSQEFSFEVGPGASLEVLSQSFDKVHRMEDGRAKRHISIMVDKNAELSYAPQPVIPFAGSAFDSEMQVHLSDESSRFFLQEIMSSGRNAYQGEAFAYRRYSSKVLIYRGGELIYRDNTRFEPDQMPMADLGFFEGYSHLANLFLTCGDKDIKDEIWDLIDSTPDCEGGVTGLTRGDLAVRILSRRAQILQNLSDKIKKIW